MAETWDELRGANNRRLRGRKIHSSEHRSIRNMYAAGIPQYEIAARYGVEQSAISKIVTGTTSGAATATIPMPMPVTGDDHAVRTHAFAFRYYDGDYIRSRIRARIRNEKRSVLGDFAPAFVDPWTDLPDSDNLPLAAD